MIKYEDIKIKERYVWFNQVKEEFSFYKSLCLRLENNRLKGFCYSIIPDRFEGFSLCNIFSIFYLNNFVSISDKTIDYMSKIFNDLLLLSDKFNTIYEEKHLSDSISNYDLLSFEKQYQNIQAKAKKYCDFNIIDITFKDFICGEVLGSSGYYQDIFLKEFKNQFDNALEDTKKKIGIKKLKDNNEKTDLT